MNFIINIGFTIVLLALYGCNSGKNLTVEPEIQPNTTFVVQEVHKTDDEEATNDLSRFFKDNSFEVERFGANAILVKLDNKSKFLLEPIIGDDLHRIKITSVFTIKPEYINSIEVIQALLEANSKMNFGQFSISEDGDNLYVVSNVTFIDNVDIKEILTTMKYTDNVFYTAYDRLQYMKKVVK